MFWTSEKDGYAFAENWHVEHHRLRDLKGVTHAHLTILVQDGTYQLRSIELELLAPLDVQGFCRALEVESVCFEWRGAILTSSAHIHAVHSRESPQGLVTVYGYGATQDEAIQWRATISEMTAY